jgi:hypothetical protein
MASAAIHLARSGWGGNERVGSASNLPFALHVTWAPMCFPRHCATASFIGRSRAAFSQHRATTSRPDTSDRPSSYRQVTADRPGAAGPAAETAIHADVDETVESGFIEPPISED